jgi:hypothetical protein
MESLPAVTVELVTDPDTQLPQIKALQNMNLRRNLSNLEQGFVTAEYEVRAHMLFSMTVHFVLISYVHWCQNLRVASAGLHQQRDFDVFFLLLFN